ncbi:hypothetical protein L6R29_17635, partial [Myxococcota bacterium]|nr:hypothetical protein [Myxococcota bacterium]
PNNTELPTSPTSTPPQPPRSAWRAFFPKSSLQKYCNQIFVNFSATDLNASFVNLRLGFVTDGDSTCKTPNGFIGIGGRSRLLPSISAGNLCTNSSSCETNDTTKPALIGLYIRDLPPIKSTLKRVLGVLQPSTGPIPRSCLAYRMPPHNHTNNDNYWIQPANSPLPMITFCEMTRHGGGWTALLKTNNTAQFAYDSALWTNTATLNESPTVNPVFTDAYKLNTFHSFPIEELLVSLHNTNSSALYVNYFSFLFSASSMLNAIQIPRRFDNEDPRPWRDLLPDTNLHSGCTQIGTTLTPAANNNYAHLRLGLIAAPDQPLLCTIASSYIGLGAKLSACNVNNAPSTGHAIGCITTGAAPQITPATGYLFAR